MCKKTLSIIVSLCFFWGATFAEDVPTASPQDEYAKGLIRGEWMAYRECTNLKWATIGLGAGICGGLIGAGICYVVASSKDPGISYRHLVGKSADYQVGFREAYTNEGQSINKKRALLGGLAGTALWVLVIVAANSKNNK
jgi:hypothetical protein